MDSTKARGETDSSGGFEKDRKLGRKVVAIGNSAAVTLPSEWRSKVGISVGDAVDLEYDQEAGEITVKF